MLKLDNIVKVYKTAGEDVTALRDPLAGLGLEEGSFEQSTGDAMALDYKGQPREKNRSEEHTSELQSP